MERVSRSGTGADRCWRAASPHAVDQPLVGFYSAEQSFRKDVQQADSLEKEILRWVVAFFSGCWAFRCRSSSFSLCSHDRCRHDALRSRNYRFRSR
jgi:hypothetical protein